MTHPRDKVGNKDRRPTERASYPCSQTGLDPSGKQDKKAAVRAFSPSWACFLKSRTALRVSLLLNGILLVASLVLLTLSPAKAMPQLGVFQPPSGYLMRYFSHILLLQPGDAVMVQCASSEPEWESEKAELAFPIPGESQRYYYAACPAIEPFP